MKQPLTMLRLLREAWAGEKTELDEQGRACYRVPIGELKELFAVHGFVVTRTRLDGGAVGRYTDVWIVGHRAEWADRKRTELLVTVRD